MWRGWQEVLKSAAHASLSAQWLRVGADSARQEPCVCTRQIDRQLGLTWARGALPGPAGPTDGLHVCTSSVLCRAAPSETHGQYGERRRACGNSQCVCSLMAVRRLGRRMVAFTLATRIAPLAVTYFSSIRGEYCCRATSWSVALLAERERADARNDELARQFLEFELCCASCTCN